MTLSRGLRVSIAEKRKENRTVLRLKCAKRCERGINRSRLALASRRADPTKRAEQISRVIDERGRLSTPITGGGFSFGGPESELAYIASQRRIVASYRGARTLRPEVHKMKKQSARRKPQKNMMKGMKEAAEES
jgi:hypothetical protein